MLADWRLGTLKVRPTDFIFIAASSKKLHDIALMFESMGCEVTLVERDLTLVVHRDLGPTERAKEGFVLG